MTEFDTTYGDADLAILPTTRIDQVFGCVRCGRIPHPTSFLSCLDRGHMICGPCVDEEVEEAKDKKGVDGSTLGGRKCCSVEKLRQGNSVILDYIFESSTWRCVNYDQGCGAVIMGKEMTKHLMTCNFHGLWHCYYFGCSHIYVSLTELIDHYKSVHEAVPISLESDDKKHFEFQIILEEFPEQRVLALLEFGGCMFLFACELFKKNLHMWLWSVDNPIVRKMNDTKYMIRLCSALEGPESNDPAQVYKFIGVAKPYLRYTPSQMTMKDPASCSESSMVDSHFIVPESKYRELWGDAQRAPLVVIGIKELSQTPLELKLSKLKSKART